MRGECFGEGGTAFNLVGKIAENLVQRGVAALCLAFQGADGAHQRQTCLKKGRQLTGCRRQCLCGDFGRGKAKAHTSASTSLSAAGLGLNDTGWKQPLLFQLGSRGNISIGFNEAFLLLAVPVHSCVLESCHSIFLWLC